MRPAVVIVFGSWRQIVDDSRGMPAGLVPERPHRPILGIQDVGIWSRRRRRVCITLWGALHTRGRGVVLSIMRRPRLAPGDGVPHAPNLFDIMNLVWRFRVLVLDVQVKMSPQRGRGEGLMAEGTLFVFGCGQLAGARGWRRYRGVGHGRRGGRMGEVMRKRASLRCN